MAYGSKRDTTNHGIVPLASNLYGTCSTSASAKIVSMPDFDVLTEGVTIHVHFTNAQDGPATLQVGSTSAVPVSNGASDPKWGADSFISFTYYNGKWYQNDSSGGSVSPGSLVDMFYPVGSYNETSDTTFDPNTAWGGTWVLETEGLVHIGAGQNYSAGATGGSADAIVVAHSHDVDAVDIPSSGGHSHTVYSRYRSNDLQSGSNRDSYTSATSITTTVTTMSYIASNSGAHTHTVPAHQTASEGQNGTGANMQPYIAVNRWHRTA